MLPKIKHFPVNWADGMLIDKQHFIDHDNALYDQVRDGLAQNMTNFNYGLLTPLQGEDKSLQLWVNVEDANAVKIKVLSCRAVTRGGARIEIGKEQDESVNVPFNVLEAEYDLSDIKNQEFDIIIVVNPFKRMPIGAPDPEENPPRHLFTMPQYLIEIVASNQVNRSEFTAFHIPIGRLQAKVGRVKFAEYYVPPCTSLESHPILTKRYQDNITLLSDWTATMTQIIRKIKSKSEPSPLSKNTAFLIERLTFFIADTVDEFRLTCLEKSPLFLVAYFMRFARTFKTTLRCMVEDDREELLNYLSDWIEETPGEFDNLLNSIMQIEYDHYDSRSAFEQIDKLIDTIQLLLTKLKHLDYIGHKKDANKIEEKSESKLEFNEAMKQKIKDELKPEIKEELKPEIKGELKPEIKEELLEELREVPEPVIEVEAEAKKVSFIVKKGGATIVDKDVTR